MSIFFTNRVPSGWPRLYKAADRLGDRAGRLNHGQRPPCLDRPAIPPQESKNGIVPGTQEVSLWGGGMFTALIAGAPEVKVKGAPLQ